jgi:hypothetical protein
MIIQEPIPHWNNFTVPELKEILEHCRALERLGIAQDEEMMVSIERDITLREKKLSAPRYVPFESKPTKIKQQTVKQIHSKTNKRQQPQDYLLAQNV